MLRYRAPRAVVYGLAMGQLASENEDGCRNLSNGCA